MSDKPFAISEIADPEQIRVMVYNGERIAHAPLKSILEFAGGGHGNGGSRPNGGKHMSGCGTGKTITITIPENGPGDMKSEVYDPNCVAKDAFDMDSMKDGKENRLFTKDDRAKLDDLRNHSDEITAVQNEVNANKALIQTNIASIKTAQNTADVAQGIAQKNQSSIIEANKEIKNIEASLTTTKGIVNDNTNKIGGLDTRVQTLEAKPPISPEAQAKFDKANQDIAGVKNIADSNLGKIGGLDKRIKTLEDEPKIPPDLEAKVGRMEGEIADAKQCCEQNAISLQAAQKAAQDSAACCEQSKDLIIKAEAAAKLSSEKATAAEESSRASKVASDAAIAKADQAIATSNSAVDTANKAEQTANKASTASEQAVNTANAAHTTSDEALRIAKEAKVESGEAKASASQAEKDCTVAKQSAETAVDAASKSAASANQAQESAKHSAESATSAITTANAASETANIAKAASDKAIADSKEALETSRESDYKSDHAVGEATAAKDVADQALKFSEEAEKCCKESKEMVKEARDSASNAESSAKNAENWMNKIKDDAEEAITSAKSSSLSAKEAQIAAEEARILSLERQYMAINVSAFEDPFLDYKDKAKLVLRKGTNIPIFADNVIRVYSTYSDEEIAVPGKLKGGTDYYVYLCIDSKDGGKLKIVVSDNSTFPKGYTANTSRKIGGFHTLCIDVGKIDKHPLSDFKTGDILPQSVWCLNHRPYSSPEGMVFDKSTNIWIDIYLMSSIDSTPKSAYKAIVSNNRKYEDYCSALLKVRKSLLSEVEFSSAALGSNEGTSFHSEPAAVTGGGHKDSNNRRMISNIGLEDACGYVWQALDEVISYTYVQFGATYVHLKWFVAGGDHTTGTKSGPWLRNGLINRADANKKIAVRGKSIPKVRYECVQIKSNGTLQPPQPVTPSETSEPSIQELKQVSENAREKAELSYSQSSKAVDTASEAKSITDTFATKLDDIIKAETQRKYHYDDEVPGIVSLRVRYNTAQFLTASRTNKTELILDAGTVIPLVSSHGTRAYMATSAITIQTNVGDSPLKPAKDYYVYVVSPSSCKEADLKIVVSDNSTFPDGFSAENSRKIGGFHTFCMAMSEVNEHDLKGFMAGDILPQSVWCLSHRPRSASEGMVYSPVINAWVDIYLTSLSEGRFVSVFGGNIVSNNTYAYFIEGLTKVGKRIPDDWEFSCIAQGSNNFSYIKNKDTAANITGGNVDSYDRRMVSNIGAEDCCGHFDQWIKGIYSLSRGFGISLMGLGGGGDKMGVNKAGIYNFTLLSRTDTLRGTTVRGISEPLIY